MPGNDGAGGRAALHGLLESLSNNVRLVLNEGHLNFAIWT